jgi:hypothetical protein
VPVATFYRALNLSRPQPDAKIKIEDREVIERHIAVPPAKDVHILMVYHRTVTKPDLGILQQVQIGGNQILSEQRPMVLRILVDKLDWHGFPAVGADLVLMDIGKDMGFVAAPVYVKVVEVADEGVICAGLRRILRIEIYPFVLESLVLCQIVEVVASFAGVASEEENTVLKCQTVCARSRGWNLVFIFSFWLNLPPEISFCKELRTMS